MRTPLLLILGTGALVAGSQAPTPAEKIKPYRTWVSVTPEPVDMAASTAMLCVIPTKWMPPNPHMPKVFKVYVNPPGAKAFKSERPKFPVGTMIVKEKYDATMTTAGHFRGLKPGAKPELMTAMVKRSPGYDPENGDWEYLVLDRAMKRREGKVTVCQSCHLEVKDRDFVFADYVGGIRPFKKVIPMPTRKGSQP